VRLRTINTASGDPEHTIDRNVERAKLANISLCLMKSELVTKWDYCLMFATAHPILGLIAVYLSASISSKGQDYQ
jgi:hypothetical protein